MLRWSSHWCLYLNTDKCSVLHIGEKNTDCDYFMSIGEVDYKINNSPLVKDLGVTLILIIIIMVIFKCYFSGEHIAHNIEYIKANFSIFK